jgi:hypothetical protein
METYHKINAPFKRHLEGPDKGKLILGDWSLPVFGYLADCLWEFTEKVDGTNIRIGLRRASGENVTDVEIGGRTNNAVIPDSLLWVLNGMFTDATANAEVTKWMQRNELSDVILFGEGYGPKIQGGGKYRTDHSFVLFDVKVGNFWLDRDNVNDVGNQLGIDTVPILGIGTLWDSIDIVSGKRDDYSLIEGTLASQWGDFAAEGLVIRPVVPLFDRRGERVVTKIKAKDFK